MPRKSLAEVTTLPRVDGRPAPLATPSDLSEGAAAIWRSIVAVTPTEHFRASDAPLLKAYVEACAMTDNALMKLGSDGAVGAGGKVSPWLQVFEKATRVQNTLALRLRLCPSARTDPKTTGRGSTPTTPKPWK